METVGSEEGVANRLPFELLMARPHTHTDYLIKKYRVACSRLQIDNVKPSNIKQQLIR